MYGYFYATTYHLGSLLYGSFLCTIFRVLRMLAAMLVRASEETGNPVAQCFLSLGAHLKAHVEQGFQWFFPFLNDF